MKNLVVWLVLFAALCSPDIAAAASQSGRTTYKKQVMTAASASAAHTTTDNTDAAVLGKAIDFGLNTFASFQINWTSLTGTIDSTLTAYASVDCTNYTVKDDTNGNPVTVTLSGASGTAIININGIVTEPCYQLRYAPVDVTGGTVNVFAYGK